MFAPGAAKFVGPPAALAALSVALAGLGSAPPAFVGLAVGLAGLAIFFAVFFRDPERTIGPGLVSAADGRVHRVEREGDRWRVAVFMSVTNVHVNRAPAPGTVREMDDRGSAFRPAYRPDALHNRQRRYRFDSAYGSIEVVQITGILARRLVSFVRPGARLDKGERFGMIVLGSRVDVLFPAERLTPSVAVGDRVRAGASSIAREDVP